LTEIEWSVAGTTTLDREWYCLTETKLDNYDEAELDGYKLLPPVNRQNCKARSGGICDFVRDFFCKYVHVNDPFTNS
jgi:hypothetical protein